MAENPLFDRLVQQLATTDDPAEKAAIIAEITFDQLPPPIATVAQRCIILRWFDETILAALLPENAAHSAAEVAAQLADLPFVEQLAWGGLTYHDLTRSGLLARYAAEQAELLKQAAALATPAYQNYADPKLAGPEALFCLIVSGQAAEASQQLDRLIKELGGQEDWNGLLALLATCDQTATIPFVTPLQRTAYHHYSIGVALRQLGKLEEAIAAYQQAIALDEKYAAPWNGLGNVYSDQKRYDDAIAAYQQAIALDDKVASRWNNLGNVYRDLKQYNEAIAAYQQAIALDEKLTNPWHGLGNVYREQKRYDEAIAAFQQAITLNDKIAWSWNGLGGVYRDLKRYEEAISAFRQAITLDGKFAAPCSNLGSVLYQLERWTEAIGALRSAVTIDPTRLVNWMGLAGAALHAGDEETWRTALTQAQPLVDYTDLYNAACFESVADNVDRALELLAQAAATGQLNPAWAREDPDLHWVRHDPRFWELVGWG